MPNELPAVPLLNNGLELAVTALCCRAASCCVFLLYATERMDDLFQARSAGFAQRFRNLLDAFFLFSRSGELDDAKMAQNPREIVGWKVLQSADDNGNQPPAELALAKGVFDVPFHPL